MGLRSEHWYAGQDRNAYIHRAWMRRGGPDDGFTRPQIAIANTASDLTPCNAHLNEVEPFKSELNPTTENVALHVARTLQLPPHVRVKSVEVWETAANSAIYRPG